MWIDTHAHLDAPEFDGWVRFGEGGGEGGGSLGVRAAAATAGVLRVVWPAVTRAHWRRVAQLATEVGDAFALGMHPLYVPSAFETDLSDLKDTLADTLANPNQAPHLVAVGEIGLDFFEPHLCTPEIREKQTHFYTEQLKLAAQFGLPVILHVRRSADALLKHLRPWTRACVAKHGKPLGGIAHAFNGSEAQAHEFIKLGFKLGFGGAVTYERAQNLRRLVTTLPLESIVLETDSPDMPPQWLYTTKAQREAGEPQGINTPAELPRIAQVIADLRGISLEELAEATTANACAALPKLKGLLPA